MKEILNEIASALEDALTNAAAMETFLTQRGLLEVGELDRYVVSQQLPQHLNLARLRNLISSLPD